MNNFFNGFMDELIKVAASFKSRTFRGVSDEIAKKIKKIHHNHSLEQTKHLDVRDAMGPYGVRVKQLKPTEELKELLKDEAMIIRKQRKRGAKISRGLDMKELRTKKRRIKRKLLSDMKQKGIPIPKSFSIGETGWKHRGKPTVPETDFWSP